MIWMSHLDSDLAGSLYAPVILASPVLQSARRRKKKGRRGRGGEGCGQLEGSPAAHMALWLCLPLSALLLVPALTDDLSLALLLQVGPGHLHQSGAHWVLVTEALIGWVDHHLHGQVCNVPHPARTRQKGNSYHEHCTLCPAH